jgi:DUF4097 and DUF4098 domain-containing protein YvlB
MITTHTVVRSLRALLLASVLPMTLLAQDRGDRVDSTFTLDRGGVVHLGAVSGEIRITGSDRRDVRVNASMDRGRFEVTSTRSRLSVTTKSVQGRQSGTRFDVNVPTGTRISASTVSGRIEVRATEGEVIVRTTSGSVDIRNAKERVEVSTVSGDVELSRVSGRIRVDGVSSTIYADDIAGDFSVETVSGEITMRRGALTGLVASAVSGTITYEGTLSATGSYRLNAHSGTVTLGLPANVGAILELETFSGRINSDFPLTLQPGETGGRRGRRMEFTLGNGGARVTAGAFSGNINIRRGSAAGDRE